MRDRRRVQWRQSQTPGGVKLSTEDKLRSGEECSASGVINSKPKILMSLQPGAPKNPRAVAEAILGALAGALEAQGPGGVQLAEPPALAGPGFINLRLSEEWMGRRVQTMLHQVRRSGCLGLGT